MPRTEDEIQAEANELDVPILMVTDALQLVADHLDIDLLPWLLKNQESTTGYHAENADEKLLGDILDYALESSLQMPHIIRAIELDNELGEL